MQLIYNNLLKRQGRRDSLKENLRAKKRELKALKKDQVVLDESLVVAQQVARLTQEELQYRISDIVTKALHSVFGSGYEFMVYFEIKRGKTEAQMVFLKDGQEVDPLSASGGGVVEVAAFALRLSCFLITTPKPAKTILMDEPLKALSVGYRPAMAEFIEEISSQLGIQIIMVTHCEEFEIGNIIRIKE